MPKSILACWVAIIPLEAPATVLLNLFPDATFIAERDGAQATSTGGGLVWTGHLQGVPASTATLVAEDGVLVGNVQAADRFYEVRYARRRSPSDRRDESAGVRSRLARKGGCRCVEQPRRQALAHLKFAGGPAGLI